MRFRLNFGRLVIFDFTLFEIREHDEEMIIVEHRDADDDRNDGPDLFGK